MATTDLKAKYPLVDGPSTTKINKLHPKVREEVFMIVQEILLLNVKFALQLLLYQYSDRKVYGIK